MTTKSGKKHKRGKRNDEENDSAEKRAFQRSPDVAKIATDSQAYSESEGRYQQGVNKNARLIVRNIPFKATEDSLRDHFAQYGNVEEVKLLKTADGRLVGCGFVHFTNVPMANEALVATNKKAFLGRPLSVAWAVPKFKYEEANNQSTKKEKLEIISSEEQYSKDNIKRTKQDREPKQKTVPVKRKARLIVRNISFKATEDSLKEHFAPYGDILEVKVLKKPNGKLIGCAFVQFKNVPMAKKAMLNTNMKPFLDRPISVDWAIAKNEYMQHHINKQLEMQEDIKKEDSDDDDDGPPLNISVDDVKAEVKSESEDDVKSENDSSDEDSDDDVKSEKDESSDEDSDEEEEPEASDDDDDASENDDESIITQPRERIKLNDAEDGCTVFITNIPFSVDNDQLKEFAEKTGPVKYALICVDKLTEHSKGTGFIKFTNKEDADSFLALPASELRLDGQTMQAKPALKRENLQGSKKKEAKDNRNLYLVKEGVIVAGTKAAVGLSASDMAKRLALEKSKTQMLKNLNRFVSRYRLVIANLPQFYDDAKLRRVCVNAVGKSAVVTEARVMRDLRAPPGKDGKHPSKGYGFVMFTRHEDALACLRKLNNNPDVFDKNNRPIISFSIEDRTALNARKKRLEKSIANNPQNKKDENEHENQKQYNKRRDRKRKMQAVDESYVKKARKDGPQKGPWKPPAKHQDTQNVDEYSGLTAKEGSQHNIRSNQKLRTQAQVHRENVKLEKKKGKRAMKFKMAAKERVKQPKQPINKNPSKKKRRFKRNKSVL